MSVICLGILPYNHIQKPVPGIPQSGQDQVHFLRLSILFIDNTLYLVEPVVKLKCACFSGQSRACKSIGENFAIISGLSL